LPLAWLAYAIAREVSAPGTVLGADPGEAVVEFLGEWGIRILLLTLCVSPLRRLTGNAQVAGVRRMVGLFAFAYLALHFSAYLGFLALFDWALIVEDLSERSYIMVGLLALIILALLSLTSTRGWQRRLRRNWQHLHWGIYPAMLLGLLHLWWLTKDGFGDVVLYGTLTLVLLGERLALSWYTYSGGERKQ
jgi:sulfoxide reductase heme-binding subunit YedZ